MASWGQRRPAGARVLPVDKCTPSRRGACERAVRARTAGKHQCRRALPLLQLEVGAAGDEHAHDRVMANGNGEHEDAAALRIAAIDVATLVKPDLELVWVTTRHRLGHVLGERRLHGG